MESEEEDVPCLWKLPSLRATSSTRSLARAQEKVTAAPTVDNCVRPPLPGREREADGDLRLEEVEFCQAVSGLPAGKLAGPATLVYDMHPLDAERTGSLLHMARGSDKTDK